MDAPDPRNTATQSYALAPGGGPPSPDEQVDVASEEMLVNMGPQHPSTHGVLRVVLRTDGEMVLDAVPHLGYLHRCKEKNSSSMRLSRADSIQSANRSWSRARSCLGRDS